MDTIQTDTVRELRAELGDDAVRSSVTEIVRFLRDNSWLSPVHQAALAARTESDGAGLGVLAVVTPADEAAVMRLAALAARRRLPLTPRGAGTSNFGLLTPSDGGLIVDMRGLTGPAVITGDAARAAAGTLQGNVESAARAAGRELPVLTTTYAQATIAGWIAGGHVGLGSGVHGSIWDGNVIGARVVTIEEQPRVLDLTGDAAVPLLHTFGAIGLMTEVTLRTDVRHDWLEAVAFFPAFEQASAYVTEISRDRRYRHRACAAQEAELMPGLGALAPIRQPGAGVLLVIDRSQTAEFAAVARAHGGTLAEWQTWEIDGGAKPSIAAMVYGHRMLWVKKLFPEAAFLHIYFDPEDPAAGVRALKGRYGDEVLVEMKFVRSPWMLEALGYRPDATLPAAVVSLRDGSAPGKVDEVLRFCDEIGLRYQNSHTNVIEDNGLFRDVASIVRLKAEADPYDLLNRGRLRSATRRP
ncbi:MAG: FAD-binding oxidoreductase [Candidatus Lustribacter sp.]|jgi:FAD/FMN-containing dehydrogenase